MAEITLPEIKLMVDLVRSESPLISPEEINYKICEIWEIYVPLRQIYQILDISFDEDFELENRKLQYYD